jgi:glycogen operon protein
LDKPDWGVDSHAIAVAFRNHALNDVRYIAINSYWNTLNFELPPLPEPSSRWIRMIDTSLASPEDITDVERGCQVMASTYSVNPHSIVMLHHASSQMPQR